MCAMEQVLAVYQRPFDPDYPLICMDESSVQCVKEVRLPLPVRPGRTACYDAEYERNGVAHLMQFYAPLSGWRRLQVADNHAAGEWARGVRRLVEQDFPGAKRITLVMDNLNTHCGASLYKVFKRRGPCAVGETGVCLHAEAWQLVEYGRMRVQRAGAPVFESAIAGYRHSAAGSQCLVYNAQPS